MLTEAKNMSPIAETSEIPPLKTMTLSQMVEVGLDVVGVREESNGCFSKETIYLRGAQQTPLEGAELVHGYTGLETKVVLTSVVPRHVFTVGRESQPQSKKPEPVLR